MLGQNGVVGQYDPIELELPAIIAPVPALLGTLAFNHPAVLHPVAVSLTLASVPAIATLAGRRGRDF